MSLWDSFTNIISSGVQSVVQGAENLVGYQPQTPQLKAENELQQKAKNKIAEITAPWYSQVQMVGSNRDNPISRFDASLTKKSTDAMLYIAKAANDKIISPLITRPVATFGIVTDPNSALYKEGKYGKGFQLTDIIKGYNRSKFVSPMDALASNPAFTGSPIGLAVQGASNIFNGPKFNKVDVFSNTSIKENYHDNIFGKVFTGVGDVALSIPMFGVVGKGLGVVARVAGKTSGLVADGTLVGAMTKFDADATNGITHVTTGGIRGADTVAGRDMVKLASTTDHTKVFNTWKDYSNNPELLPFVVKESDPLKIKDLILADNGDLAAMERVLVNQPVEAYVALGGKEAVAQKLFENYGVYAPEGETMTRLRDVFQKSLEASPEHKSLYDALMNPESKNPNMLGKGNFPLETALGRGIDNISGWTENVLGTHNSALTRVIKYTGMRMPRGYVTFSGTRPYDGVDELTSAFDSMKIFRNPDNMITIGPDKAISAGEYRRLALAKYIDAVTPEARYGVVKEIDTNIGMHYAMTKGFWKGKETQAVIQQLQDRIYGGHNALATKGYAIDFQGHMVEVDAKTQSQLANTYRMVPWHLLEKEINLHGATRAGGMGIKTLNTGELLFNEINKFWSLDVIGKPSYIPKQSIFEPMVGAWIAAGAEHITSYVPTAIKNFSKNSTNRLMGASIKTTSFLQRKAVAKTLGDLTDQLDKAVMRRDLLQQEYEDFFVYNIKSPKTISVYGDQVKSELRQAESVVDDIEHQYRSAVKPWGKPETVPTKATLERRIAYLQSLGESGVNINAGSAIANAKAALAKARGNMNTLMPDVAEIYANDAKVASTYKQIDKILTDMKGAHKDRADVFGRTEKYKTRYYGKPVQYRFINGEYVPLKSIYDENAMGAALRGETSNAATTARTYANELNVGTRYNRQMRYSPTTVTDVNDVQYFEELAHLMNRSWRQDPLIKQILAGQDKNFLVQWGNTLEGKTYFKDFGIDSASDVPARIDDIYGIVNRYIPNVETQKLILKKDVLSTELERGLANNIDILHPIQPQDFNYAQANSSIGSNWAAESVKFADRVTSQVFQTLMRPENPIRWAYVEKRTADIQARKAEALFAQGSHLSVEQINALKKASLREAVSEMEKTFYTITRANRLIYATRVATAFPTATMNAFYRYSRFALKYPVNTLGFLKQYNSMFTSFGIDQYGNPVKDVLDATHLMVPGTDLLGFFGGKGIRLSAKSVGFMLNTPSPSVYTAVSTTELVKRMPSADAFLQSHLGPIYDTVFPYGTETASLKNAFTPSYLRDGVAWLRGADGQTAFLNSWRSVYDYHQVLVSMGIEKKTPSNSQILAETNGLWKLKAAYEFASPFGVPAKVDTTPMTLFQQLYYMLVNQNKAKGMNPMDASTQAGVDFLSTMGASFPLDQITYTGSPARAYVPPTQEAYNRVFNENPKLTAELTDIAKGDISVVSLMTTDLDVTDANRSPVITKRLKDPSATLPGVDGPVALNEPRLTPQQIETQRLNARTWNQFFVIKDALDTIARTTPRKRGGGYYKSMASVPELEKALKDYAIKTLGKENPSWLSQEYQSSPSSGDKSYIYATGLKKITDNDKFMLNYGGGKFWSDALLFTSTRNQYVDLYNGETDTKMRTAIKDAYNARVADNIDQYDPKLQRIITMYFSNDTMKKAG